MKRANPKKKKKVMKTKMESKMNLEELNPKIQIVLVPITRKMKKGWW